MRLEKEAALLSKAGLGQMLLVALLYGGLLYCSILFCPMLYGVELRLVTFVAIAGGFIFGLPGAIGACLGNFSALLLHGDDLGYVVFTSYGNFLLAYFPYRFWYGYQSKKATLFVYNNRTFVKLMNILLINSVHFTMVMSPLFMLYNHSFSLNAVIITFANNFFFPVIFGVPLLMLWSRYSKVRYYPAAEKGGLFAGYGMIFHGMLFILDVFVLFLAYRNWMEDMFAWFVVVAGLLLYSLLTRIPSQYKVHATEQLGVKTVSADILFKLFCVVDMMLILSMVSAIHYSFRYPSSWLVASNWMQLIQELFSSLVIMTLALYCFLRYVEREMIYPIHRLNKQVDAYRASGDISILQEIASQAKLDQIRNQDEVSVLACSLQKMGLDIQQYVKNLDNIVMEQQQFNTQMKVAAAIQQGVLPQLGQLQAKLPGYQLLGDMQPAKSVGGDMYNAFLVDDDHLFILVADVAGKGVPASLFMMVTQALIKDNARSMPPGEAMAMTNNALVRHNEQCLFVTVWLAVLELSSGRMKYVNAGHNPPLLYHGGKEGGEGQVEWLKAISGPVLGLMEDMDYAEYELQLREGDRLLVYTDGLNEAEDAEGNFYGNDRLVETFVRVNEPSALMADIKTFATAENQSDDMTYLWLSRDERGAE